MWETGNPEARADLIVVAEAEAEAAPVGEEAGGHQEAGVLPEGLGPEVLPGGL